MSEGTGSGRLPLARFKVIDLTHARAGPTAVRHLADYGAEVVRIENPATADAGELVGARDGFDYQNLHRNKRSLTLNLKSPEGRKIFVALAARSDVIIENLRPAVKHRLGVDYESIRAVNPRIVYGSISGFGQDGPYADRPGVDQIAQGMGGLMSVTGLPGQGPVRVGVAIADLAAGGFLAQAILIALLDREVTGRGAYVDTSLLESMISFMDFQAARWLIDGVVPQQAANNHPTGTPTGVFPSSDGHVTIAAADQRVWERFCAALDVWEFVERPEYATKDLRNSNRDALNAEIAGVTRRLTSAGLIRRINDAGVPAGPIYSVDQTFADPQVRHLAMTRPVHHPRLGTLNLVAQPHNIAGVAKALRTPTPEFGEHTDSILAELGYSEAEVAAFRREKVV
jgi:formyl-CoA transferase